MQKFFCFLPLLFFIGCRATGPDLSLVDENQQEREQTPVKPTDSQDDQSKNQSQDKSVSTDFEVFWRDILGEDLNPLLQPMSTEELEAAIERSRKLKAPSERAQTIILQIQQELDRRSRRERDRKILTGHLLNLHTDIPWELRAVMSWYWRDPDLSIVSVETIEELAKLLEELAEKALSEKAVDEASRWLDLATLARREIIQRAGEAAKKVGT